MDTLRRLIAAARRAVLVWRWYELEPTDEATEAVARSMDDLADALADVPEPSDEEAEPE